MQGICGIHISARWAYCLYWGDPDRVTDADGEQFVVIAGRVTTKSIGSLINPFLLKSYSANIIPF